MEYLVSMKVGRAEIRVAFDTLSEAEQFAREVKGYPERTVAEIALWDGAPPPSEPSEEYVSAFKLGFGYGMQDKFLPGDSLASPSGEYHEKEKRALINSIQNGKSQIQWYEERARDALYLWNEGDKSGAWELLGR